MTTAAFGRLFDTDFALWGFNSVWVSVLVTIGRVFLCSLAGYALARLRFRGRSALFTAVLAVMAVPSVVLLIPKFLVLNQLGIYDTPVALFLPLVADAAGVFIMKQFFESVPASIEEAARIDGAGTFRVFWSVVLPMARPALITLTILSFQASWNELPHFIVASQDRDLYTLTKGVATLTTGQLGSGNQFPLTLGAALLMTLPVAIVFLSSSATSSPAPTRARSRADQSACTHAHPHRRCVRTRPSSTVIPSGRALPPPVRTEAGLVTPVPGCGRTGAAGAPGRRWLPSMVGTWTSSSPTSPRPLPGTGDPLRRMLRSCAGCAAQEPARERIRAASALGRGPARSVGVHQQARIVSPAAWSAKPWCSWSREYRRVTSRSSSSLPSSASRSSIGTSRWALQLPNSAPWMRCS